MTTPNPNQNDLVVLMPARNEAHNLPAALDALAQSRNLNGKNMRIAVCANACTDNTLEVLENLKLRHKNLDVVTEWVPGKPHALNALLDHASHTRKMGSNDTIVFLDANAQVQENTIADLAIMLQRNKNLDAVAAHDISSSPTNASILDHLLFGMSEISLTSLAVRDRKASCTAVRGSVAKDMRFPENVISDDLWMSLYLGMDKVETHPDAFVLVERPRTFVGYAKRQVRHLMGLHQLEEFFDPSMVRENFSRASHEHVQALLEEPELQDQFALLPGIYQLSSVLSIPVHAVFKAAAWVGYHIKPRPSVAAVPLNPSPSPPSTSERARVPSSANPTS